MLAPAAAERVHAEHAAAARGAEHAAPGEQGQAAPRQLPQRGQPHSRGQAQGGHSLVIPDEAMRQVMLLPIAALTGEINVDKSMIFNHISDLLN